jgi:hypothetical protein
MTVPPDGLSQRMDNSYGPEETFCPVYAWLLLQERKDHLNLIEGVVVDILRAKWNSFIRARYLSTR